MTDRRSKRVAVQVSRTHRKGLATLAPPILAGWLAGCAGSSGAKAPDGRDVAAVTGRQQADPKAGEGSVRCEPPFTNARAQVIYGPGRAMVVWTLDQTFMSEAKARRVHAALRDQIAEVAERLKASDDGPDAVHFQPSLDGASITIIDSDADRLDGIGRVVKAAGGDPCGRIVPATT